MQETPQQYTKRLLGYQRGKKPMAVLASTPKRIGRLLRGVSRRQLNVRLGRDKWSAGQVLAHLADAELVFGFRMRLILGSNRTKIQAYDQDVWASYSRYRNHDPQLSFDAFRTQRERNVKLLALIPRKMWKYYGVHSERGKESITRLTEMMAGHDLNHLMQIQRLVRTRRP
jgi:hypothetical protein